MSLLTNENEPGGFARFDVYLPLNKPATDSNDAGGDLAAEVVGR